MQNIVGIRFKDAGKIYYFDPKNIEFELGDGAVVETVRGIEYGNVAIANKEVPSSEIVGQLKEVIRKATDKDEQTHVKNLAKRDSAMEKAREKIDKHNLKMKLIDAEYTFDSSKVIFYFTADGRIDFRELVKDLASVFHIRIELRQVGIRDECRQLGGLGPCGRPCCCSAHLGDFERVSIKMAKTQGLSLNPTKISGLCGRLMCCLKYENDHYTETSKIMPVVDSEITTPDGKGRVTSVDLLHRTVKAEVEVSNGATEIRSYTLEQIKATKVMAEAVDDSVDAELKEILD
ncbi:MAG: stage 0 sporulation family protein [Clostridia bacterium]|nr:stage 0 sporulation family protein [Clostridia bacterium]